MKTTITPEMETMLDLLIKRIPLKGEFSVYEFYETHILNPKYTNTEIDKSKRTAEFQANEEVLFELNTFLLHEGFAIEKKKLNGGNCLILTEDGEYLKAYGSLSLYWNACQDKLTEDDIETLLPNLLSRIAPYGEFIVQPIPVYQRNEDQFYTMNLSSNNDEAQVNYVKYLATFSGDSRERLLYEHVFIDRDREVLEYMVASGFAINRHDIKDPKKLYRQLTDKGRKLKELGSIQAYRDLERKELETAQAREQENDELIKSNITVVKIQSGLLSTNRWIALSTVVAALYYILEIIKPHASFLDLRVLTSSLIFLLGAIAGIIIYKLISNQSERKE